MMIGDCYNEDRFAEKLDGKTVRRNRKTGAASKTTSNSAFDNDATFLYDSATIEKEAGAEAPSCPQADSILNACNNIIDAAQYIGVTFDIRKGPDVLF